MSIDMGRLWYGLVGDSDPFAGTYEPTWPVDPAPAHGDIGRTRSNDFRGAGTGDGSSTGRNGCGEEGLVPRSSGCCWLTLRPSKCDLKDDTGLIGAASVPCSLLSPIFISHRRVLDAAF